MLKLSMILLIVVILSPVLIANDSYIPPTDNELLSWWGSLSQEEKILELKKLDAIEHSNPEIKVPEIVAILSKNGDLYIQMNDPLLINIDYLSYEVKIETIKIQEFYKPPEKSFIDYALPAFIGIGSAVFGTAISEQSQPWQYGVSAFGGLCFGLVLPLTL